MEERLGLAKRFQQVQTGLEQILLEAAEIRDYNQQHDGAEKLIPAQTILCSWQSSCAIKKSTERVK
ncbi:MAG: hypothetical protein ACLR13_00360 [Acutalibacteraceae bacterium]